MTKMPEYLYLLDFFLLWLIKCPTGGQKEQRTEYLDQSSESWVCRAVSWSRSCLAVRNIETPRPNAVWWDTWVIWTFIFIIPVAIVLSYKVGSVISRCHWYGGGGKRPRSLPLGPDPPVDLVNTLHLHVPWFLPHLYKGTGLELTKCESL